MSCTTLNPQAIHLTVSAGALPEGFCPASLQEFYSVMADRLLVTPNTTFNTFAIGSTAPSSNVGPWLKDCLSWFVYDDSTASYLPITKGGFDNQTYATLSGNFTVPDNIYKLRLGIWGAGGGGCTDGGTAPGGGGGSGSYACKIVAVTPGQVIPYTVGSGGSGGAPGGNGGASSILTLTAGGGIGAPIGSGFASSGGGGTATGGDININGTRGGIGIGGSNTVGSGGNTPMGGGGGVSQSVLLAGLSGVVPGGGAAGGVTGIFAGVPGNGAGGAVLIEW